MKIIFCILVAFISCSALADELYTNNIPGDCGDTEYFSAVYDALSFDCAFGYFLPAGATSCVACPDGYVCNGGTYVFNANITQGLDAGDILVQNAIGSCNTDFIQTYTAIFEPITINLNYDDGNGNVTSTTCEYGDTIAIPDTIPTRPGYNFAGWVVRQNND